MTNRRRNFIKKSALFSGAVMVPLAHFSAPIKRNYKMGLQLFTIRDAMAQDPVTTLRQVRTLGYGDTEIYGYDGKLGTFYGMKAKDFKNLLDDLQLTSTSVHYDFSSYFEKPYQELQRYLDQCIEGSLAIGSKYITWPWLAPEYRNLENFKKLSEILNKMGEQVNEAGLGLAYHNHDFEFTEYGGQTGYDIILSETEADLVKLQMDIYWVEHSSMHSPAELIAQQPGRYVMWHIKDMDKVTRDYTELGNGSIDYIEILSTINTDALQYYYLEQGGNFTQNSMQSIFDSAAYFKKYLQRYL